MLLTITTTAGPSGLDDATELGFLLHKHPDRAQRFDTAVGPVHVFWPEASVARSTVALLLEVDPVALVRRGRRSGEDGFALAQYVNDRPYVASSMLAVALGRVFRTALGGRCDARPGLAERPVPLHVQLPAVPSRGGVDLLTRLFAPLGWTVAARTSALDPERPDWGDCAYVDLHLSGTLRVADALSQLYVLIPVLDDGKHYWVSADEVDKLLRAGGGWLPAHPERQLVTDRYLKHQRSLVGDATARLAELDDRPDTEAPEPAAEPAVKPMAVERRTAVLARLRTEGAASVVDLGCGEGALLAELLADATFTAVFGADVSPRALDRAARRLGLDRMSDGRRARLRLLQSSLTYRDDRLRGYDAVVLMEVVEHLDPERLPALAASVFGHARPTTVVLTTPNAEHNLRYPGLAAGELRHADHRFEWDRRQLRRWAEAVATTYGYTVGFEPVGPDDPEVGPPTQLAVFRRVEAVTA